MSELEFNRKPSRAQRCIQSAVRRPRDKHCSTCDRPSAARWRPSRVALSLIMRTEMQSAFGCALRAFMGPWRNRHTTHSPMSHQFAPTRRSLVEIITARSRMCTEHTNGKSGARYVQRSAQRGKSLEPCTDAFRGVPSIARMYAQARARAFQLFTQRRSCFRIVFRTRRGAGFFILNISKARFANAPRCLHLPFILLCRATLPPKSSSR